MTTADTPSWGGDWTNEFTRTVRGRGGKDRARSITVTLTGGWYVTVHTENDQPVDLGAPDASDLIGALQAALHQRRQRNP